MLAEVLGVSRQTIQAIEAENFEPTLRLAFKFSNHVKLPIEDIFQDE
ncbi:MAG: helix-turn-helix domain-containing protein [Candidatus Heimdallarchaeota archaeon]|nr:helix-turn-helix domain-containing protein [Candidatus Heimdallarchaeota archaeon]